MLNKFNNYKLYKILNKYTSSVYFQFIVAMIVIIFWSISQSLIGMILLVVLATLTIIFSDDLRNFASIVALAPFIFAKEYVAMIRSGYQALYILIAIGGPILLLALIFHIIKNWENTWRNFRLGKLFVGMIIALVVSLLAGIGSDGFTWKSMLAAFGACSGMLIFYLVFKNSIKKDAIGFVSKLMIIAGCVVAIEVIILYIKVGTLQFENPDMGWGIKNTTAAIIGMALPFCFYQGYRSKHYFFYILLAGFFYTMVVISFSRGNLLFTTLALPILYVYFLHKTPYKRSMNLGVLSICGCYIIAVLILIFSNTFQELFASYISRGINDNGRFEIWKITLDMSKNNRLFGIGYLGVIADPKWQWFPGPLLKVHSTFFQIIVSNGIVGLLGFSKYYFDRYYLFFKSNKKNPFWICALVSVLIYELYGLIDLNFFIIYEIFLVFLILIAVENELTKESTIPKETAKSISK